LVKKNATKLTVAESATTVTVGTTVTLSGTLTAAGKDLTGKTAFRFGDRGTCLL
jgi:hypothetical protein